MENQGSNFEENVILTIGITAYNSGSYLREAINSVLNQTNSQWTGILVLDGGANKETKYIYNNFQHPKFKKIRFQNNRGPYGTRRKAIKTTSTKWYCQLDGDDLLPENAVEDIIRTIKNNPNAKYVFGDCEKFSKKNSFIRKPYFDEEILCYSPLFNAASPIKIELYSSLGGYDKELYINADWDFWLTAYEKGIDGAYTNSIIYNQRKRKNNIGNEFIHLRPKIVDIIIKKHPKFFNNSNRIKNAKYHVYSMLAQFYRSIGKRDFASKNVKLALEHGKMKPVFKSIIKESKMNMFRYMIRRLGRLF